MSRGYPDVLPFSGKCEGSGNYAVEIDGRFGHWVDAVGLVCRDGSRVGPFGGTGGGPSASGRCDEGLTGTTVRANGMFATQVTGGCGPGRALKAMGADLHSPSQPKAHACPAGQVVRGLSGTTRYLSEANQTYVGSLEVQCGDKEVPETNFVAGVPSSPGAPPLPAAAGPAAKDSPTAGPGDPPSGGGGPPVALLLGGAAVLLLCCSGAAAAVAMSGGGGGGGGGGDGYGDESY